MVAASTGRVDAFLEGAGAASRAWQSVEGLPQALAALVARAGAARFTAVDAERGFLAFVGRQVKKAPPGVETLNALVAEDLLLAFAALSGAAAAHAELDRLLRLEVRFVAKRLGLADAAQDELGQTLRQKLLVPATKGSPPKLADYAGRAALRHWLRVAATRTGLNLTRGRREIGSEDLVLQGAADERSDPELLALKRKYGPEFRKALRAAFGTLTAEERTVLRLFFIQGLSAAQIGTAHGTHRSTVSRWLAATREKLFTATADELKRRLNLPASELAGIGRLVESQLGQSIQSYLRREESVGRAH